MKRYQYLSAQLADPETMRTWGVAKYSKSRPTLRTRRKNTSNTSPAKEMKEAFAGAETEEDAEMRRLFPTGIRLQGRLGKLEEELKILLLPKDKNDERSCILEIRAGAGGEEAALFAAELCRMYQNYCAAHRLRVEAADVNSTELGGVKEAVYNVSGKGAYKLLKYESGVHRVQRVPETETQGRIHTSTATVAVLPRRRTWRWRSTTRISASTFSIRAGRADKTSTRSPPRCGLRISRRESSSPVRTSARS
ncbi:MAG: PCRF domain-containing protein [Christensenellaceae bacterium]